MSRKNRHTFPAALAAGFSLTIAALAASPAQAQSKPPAQGQSGNKPNIMFIMGDDIGWMQPSIYHEGLMVGETPNIDRIIRCVRV
jgi:arylsulfatase